VLVTRQPQRNVPRLRHPCYFVGTSVHGGSTKTFDSTDFGRDFDGRGPRNGIRLSQNGKIYSVKLILQVQGISTHRFLDFWLKARDLFESICNEFDKTWQQRKRCLNTQLLVIFILKMVLSKNKQGYATNLSQLWENCVEKGSLAKSEFHSSFIVM
jgi:hypothetical protein